MRILLVDDSSLVRSGIRSSIEQNTDWVCEEAENGESAVVMVGTPEPDIVVLDLSMPGMNGLETARRILAVCPGMPMIMFTMHDSQLLLKEAQQVGIKHVFSKGDGFGNEVFDAIRAIVPA